MHDRFEKEVQQKMEELKLTPSAPVWEKIEMEITVEKKRRRVIFWFLMAGLFLIAGAGWIYSISKRGHNSIVEQTTFSEPLKQEKTKTETNNLSAEKQSSVPQKTNGTINKTLETEKVITWSGKGPLDKHNVPSPNLIATRSKTSQNNIKTSQTDLTKNLPGKVSVGNKSNQQAVTTNPKPPVEQTNIVRFDRKPTANETQQQTIPPVTNSTTLDKTKEPVASTDSITKSPTKTEPGETAVTDSSLKKKIASNQKWRKQINVTAGVNAFTTGMLAKSSYSADAFSAPGTGTVTGAVNNYSPSDVQTGFGVSLGFSMVRKLSEHWEVSMGLQYTQLTSGMNVGDRRRVDTAIRFNMDKMNVDEFYTNTGQNKYTNRFHILELPVLISFKPSVQLPLYFSLGASYARLLSGNALTYSATSNVYYENDQNYNRNSIPAMASVHYCFLDKNGVSLQAGPVVQYNFTKLQKQTPGGKSHALFTGLKTTLTF